MAIGFAAFLFGGDKVLAKDITVEPADTVKPSGNTYSKDYIRVRNALKEIGEAGGGTLTVKTGHYYISNTLYVGSNTTINFEDDVTFEKLGGSACSSTMFQLIPFAQKDAVGVVGKHNGVKNVHFNGKNGTKFDMKNVNIGKTPAIAIVMGNNSNVSMEYITFSNIKNGHFIEMDGCKNVYILRCDFLNMADNKYHNKEAINLDTNDKKTGGFSQKWSKKDKTPNEKVTIQTCTFSNLVRGVGTHRYSYGKYHYKILLSTCTFSKVKTPVAMLNWKKSRVGNSYFELSKPNKRYKYSFLMAGVRGLTFVYNTMSGLKGKPVIKYYKKYQTSHKEYKPTVSKLSKQNIFDMENNVACDGTKRTFKIGKYKLKWKKKWKK